MFDNSKIVCQCNRVKAGELIELIKRREVTTLEELLDQDELEVGNKCKACKALENESTLGLVLKQANIKMLKID